MYDLLAQAMDRFYDTDALIIDLRKNGGGDLSGEFSELKSRLAEPATGKRYSKPVVFLTSNFCFSACGTFISAAKENKLATIIGESTSGGTGNPILF